MENKLSVEELKTLLVDTVVDGCADIISSGGCWTGALEPEDGSDIIMLPKRTQESVIAAANERLKVSAETRYFVIYPLERPDADACFPTEVMAIKPFCNGFADLYWLYKDSGTYIFAADSISEEYAERLPTTAVEAEALTDKLYYSCTGYSVSGMSSIDEICKEFDFVSKYDRVMVEKMAAMYEGEMRKQDMPY